MKSEPVMFRKATLEEETPAMRDYLTQCRARLEEQLGHDVLPQELTGPERARRAAELSERARVALRESGPAVWSRYGVGSAQTETVLNALRLLPLVEKVADWWRSSPKAFCVLGGKSGTGKTIAALSLFPEICSRCLLTQSGEEYWSWEHNAHLLPAVELSQQSFFDRTDRGARERAKSYRLLIVDDLGAELNTDIVKQTLLEVLDARMNNARKTLITTNLTGVLLKQRYQGRVLRRLEESGVWLSGDVDGRAHEASA